jgi:hypothetical protein
MRFGRLAALLGALLAIPVLLPDTGSAWAQLRMLPANGKRAQLTAYKNPFVVVGGEQRRLAPGAVIYDTDNRMILPGFLPDSADVVYTTDTTGSVMRIYLLNRQEQQRLDAQAR